MFAKMATGRFTFCSDTQLLPKSICYHVCYHENIFKFDYYLVSGNIVPDATDYFFRLASSSRLYLELRLRDYHYLRQFSVL